MESRHFGGVRDHTRGIERLVSIANDFLSELKSNKLKSFSVAEPGRLDALLSHIKNSDISFISSSAPLVESLSTEFLKTASKLQLLRDSFGAGKSASALIGDFNSDLLASTKNLSDYVSQTILQNKKAYSASRNLETNLNKASLHVSNILKSETSPDTIDKARKAKKLLDYTYDILTTINSMCGHLERDLVALRDFVVRPLD